MITVLNRYSAPRLEPGEIRFAVGRACSGARAGETPLHELANPFSHKDGTTAKYRVANRHDAVLCYDAYLADLIASGDPSIKRALNRVAYAVMQSKQVSLICFCAPEKCHAHSVASVVRFALFKERKR